VKKHPAATSLGAYHVIYIIKRKKVAKFYPCVFILAETPSRYTCTFEDGNLCGLRQEVNDGTDWWLVEAAFVQGEINSRRFRDHTLNSPNGKWRVYGGMAMLLKSQTGFCS